MCNWVTIGFFLTAGHNPYQWAMLNGDGEKYDDVFILGAERVTGPGDTESRIPRRVIAYAEGDRARERARVLLVETITAYDPMGRLDP